MARSAICDARSWREWDLPVLESRPEKMIGSRPPSSSGSATWRATCTGWRPRVESFHSSVVWKDNGTVHHVRHVELLQGLDRLGVILPRRAADEGEAGEGEHGVDVGDPW